MYVILADKTIAFFMDIKGTVYAFLNKPSRSELLPPMLPNEYQPPVTLVLNLQDTLVHGVWSRETNWRTQKRPNVDYFLMYLSQFYEIVVWSDEVGMASQSIDKLDPSNYVSYRLYRDALAKDNVKDLQYLNRPLDKVVTIDWNPQSVKTHPENAILVDRFVGQKDDTALLDLIPFLEFLARETANGAIQDVRELIKEETSQPDFPHGFNKRLRASMEEQRKVNMRLGVMGRAAIQLQPQVPPPQPAQPTPAAATTKPASRSLWGKLREKRRTEEQQRNEYQEQFVREREQLKKQQEKEKEKEKSS
eukprot:TRINITY_DN1506_c0_g1_i2.p1 TRINITY_DN1506_c0_g1~~TRINITY_DN1506_c0_g1_i2.p1  ORF type:complete len:306 (-),score=67.54 TRINITY_DN1506_c0_g1_i2:530-1447(-)